MRRKQVMIGVVLAIALLAAASGKLSFDREWRVSDVWASGGGAAGDGAGGNGAGGNDGVGKIAATGAILIDAKSGDVLYHKNEMKRLYPASTTKVLTALVALEHGNPADLVTVGNEVNAEEPNESRAGLSPGQQLRLSDLLNALLLPSGNDAARAIAVYIGRKSAGNTKLSAAEATRTFASLMNARAKQAGATGSHFVNPHGLHDAHHYTTARDLALIAREAMKLGAFRQIVQRETYTVQVQSGTKPVLALQNRNQLLRKDSGFYVQGINGIKTGFTDQAGYCLVSSAARGDASLIAVVLHSTSEDEWSDSQRLLEYGFRVKEQNDE